jgi:aldose sugar dehydrogenase
LHYSRLPLLLIDLFFGVSLITVIGLFPSEPTSEKNLGTRLLLNDPKLKAELLVEGIDFPSAMAILGSNDILVLEKDKGMVRRIVEGSMVDKPLLDLKLSGVGESGLVGLAIANLKQSNQISNGSAWAFLYSSVSENNSKMTPNDLLIGNRLYRYEFINDQLINPKLLLDLPTGDNIHNGGKIIIGPDKNVYVTVGDIGRFESNAFPKTLNNKEGLDPDGTGGILRMTLDGRPVTDKDKGTLGSEYPLNYYYAYGIRNSFGIDFDPLTGNLWDSENGAESKDEINLVEPGFNSGWKEIQGMSLPDKKFNPDNLVSFDGMGKYSDPEFTWYRSAVGPTAVKFLNSDKLGKEYENDMFVGDFNNGYIYHFELNEDRTKLVLDGSPKDKVLGWQGVNEHNLFAQGPGGIIDIQIGPDGYMYVLSLLQKGSECNPDAVGCVLDDKSQIKGAIFRIIPTTLESFR